MVHNFPLTAIVPRYAPRLCGQESRGICEIFVQKDDDDDDDSNDIYPPLPLL